MTIGFIGLGIMGSGMALNLLNNGVSLIVHNRTRSKGDVLLDRGAQWAERPSAMGNVSTLFTMLAHPQAVRDTALGAGGFLDALAPGTLWVDCSTVHPRFSREMALEAARRKVRFVDAPVAGTKPQAESAQLTIFVGGSDTDLAECHPYLAMMGQKVFHVGVQGMGISLKMVVNSMLAAAMATFSESVALGRSLGLSEEMLLNVLIGGPVTAPFVAAKREKIVNDDYSAHFPLKWMHKDLQMVAEAAQDVQTAVPLAAANETVYAQAVQEGFGELDFSAIYRYFELVRQSGK